MRCLRSLTNTASLRQTWCGVTVSAHLAGRHVLRTSSVIVFPVNVFAKICIVRGRVRRFYCRRTSNRRFVRGYTYSRIPELENVPYSFTLNTPHHRRTKMIAALSKLRVARLDEGELIALLTACKLMSVALLPRLLPLPLRPVVPSSCRACAVRFALLARWSGCFLHSADGMKIVPRR